MFPGICYMLGCTIVDSFLRRLLDGSTIRIGAPDRILAWYICLESLGMPCPIYLARLYLYFRACLYSALCTQQQSIYLPIFYFIFIFRYVASARRYALSNLYITNPNPNLAPIPYSSIKILGYEEKLQCPYYNYLYSHFLQIYLNTLNCA